MGSDLWSGKGDYVRGPVFAKWSGSANCIWKPHKRALVSLLASVGNEFLQSTQKIMKTTQKKKDTTPLPVWAVWWHEVKVLGHAYLITVCF